MMDPKKLVTLELRVSDGIAICACIQQVVMGLSDEAFIADLERLAKDIRAQMIEQDIGTAPEA